MGNFYLFLEVRMKEPLKNLVLITGSGGLSRKMKKEIYKNSWIFPVFNPIPLVNLLK